MINFVKRLARRPLNAGGFSLVELLIAIIIIPLMVGSISIAYNSVRKAYALSRQFNEMYAVLSACPELDRALEYSSISNSTNCYPNNSAVKENGGQGSLNYSPTLTVVDTSSLPATDPLQAVPDSKVISISVNYLPPNSNLSPLKLRMLITRNGIGQQ